VQLPPLPTSPLAFQEDRAINMDAVKRINDAAPTGWRTGGISRIVPGQRAKGQGVASPGAALAAAPCINSITAGRLNSRARDR
jgi:hypothetical protein